MLCKAFLHNYSKVRYKMIQLDVLNAQPKKLTFAPINKLI